MSTTVFLEPLDVLFLRGNKLFGEPGSYGEALLPPWPSVAAGALRSRMLVDAGVDPQDFARGKAAHEALGTPSQPGPFTVTAFHLGRRYADGRTELLIAPPADLVISEEGGRPRVNALRPTGLAVGDGATSGHGQLQCSAQLAKLAVLPEPKRSKPASGYWLTESGWRKYLRGELPAAEDFVKSDALWRFEHRVGVGLNAENRRAEDGRLFSLQAIAMVKREHLLRNENGAAAVADYDAGFIVQVAGATPPTTGLVRLGGDGRGAMLHPVAHPLPEPDYEAIARAGRCRMVLTSPGIFTQGWLPTGCKQRDDHRTIDFKLGGVQAKLVCAAVPRFEVVSGWDLAQWQPKSAQRAAPTGSVYWLEEVKATPEALRKLAEQGLWNNPCEDEQRRAERSTAEELRKLAEQGLWNNPCEDEQRRAEGFNRITFAAWLKE